MFLVKKMWMWIKKELCLFRGYRLCLFFGSSAGKTAKNASPTAPSPLPQWWPDAWLGRRLGWRAPGRGTRSAFDPSPARGARGAPQKKKQQSQHDCGSKTWRPKWHQTVHGINSIKPCVTRVLFNFEAHPNRNRLALLVDSFKMQQGRGDPKQKPGRTIMLPKPWHGSQTLFFSSFPPKT